MIFHNSIKALVSNYLYPQVLWHVQPMGSNCIFWYTIKIFFKINMSLHVCRKAVKLQIMHTKISIKKTKEIGKELFSKILKDVQVTNLEYLLASVTLTNM